MEAEKSQGLRLDSKRPRRANGLSSSLSLSSNAREDQGLSWKTVRQREQILPYSAFLFDSGLQWIGWGWDLLTLGRQSALCSLMIQALISSRNTLTPRIMFNWISAHSMAESNWHIKLTVTQIKNEKALIVNCMKYRTSVSVKVNHPLGEKALQCFLTDKIWESKIHKEFLTIYIF